MSSTTQTWAGCTVPDKPWQGSWYIWNTTDRREANLIGQCEAHHSGMPPLPPPAPPLGAMVCCCKWLWQISARFPANSGTGSLGKVLKRCTAPVCRNHHRPPPLDAVMCCCDWLRPQQAFWQTDGKVHGKSASSVLAVRTTQECLHHRHHRPLWMRWYAAATGSSRSLQSAA